MISDGKNLYLLDGYNHDIVEAEKQCYEWFKEQPKDHVAEVAASGASVRDKCLAVFKHLVAHVQYQLDPDGKQLIKSPARLLADGCGDCKSLTMYINYCLYCLGIRHKFRFVNFDGGDQYTHVYAVALDERDNEIILDACEKDDQGYTLFDYARPYKVKLDVNYC